jgi:hypothetical protein
VPRLAVAAIVLAAAAAIMLGSAAAIVAAFASPAGLPGKHKLYYEVWLTNGASSSFTITAEAHPDFYGELRVPTQGRARLLITGKGVSSWRGSVIGTAPVIDTKSSACTASDGWRSCRIMGWEPLSTGKYTWRLTWTGRPMRAELTLYW